MNQLEILLEKCDEKEKEVAKQVLQECVEEYNTLRKSHPDVTIYTDNLNQPSAFSEAVSGISNMFYYGFTGISSLLETAAAYSTVVMANVSDYIADYLNSEETTVNEDVSNEVGAQKPSGIVEESKVPVAEEAEVAVEEKVEVVPEEKNENVNNPEQAKVEAEVEEAVEEVAEVTEEKSNDKETEE